MRKTAKLLSPSIVQIKVAAEVTLSVPCATAYRMRTYIRDRQTDTLQISPVASSLRLKKKKEKTLLGTKPRLCLTAAVLSVLLDPVGEKCWD